MSLICCAKAEGKLAIEGVAAADESALDTGVDEAVGVGVAGVATLAPAAAGDSLWFALMLLLLVDTDEDPGAGVLRLLCLL